MIITIGLPGSGKSTLARQFKGFTIIEGDQIEREISEKFSPETWKQSRQICFERVQQELQSNNVIVDDNFELPSMRKPYLRLAQKLRINYLQL